MDFAQQDRVIEVIARLPFDNPKDPFYQKIESWFSKQGKSTFESYSLPMTVLRFKQAIGRAKDARTAFSYSSYGQSPTR
ncbi:MAG: helicase C-terminal domain-containing protein [Streptococcus sp.]